jgi:hypothetical protein
MDQHVYVWRGHCRFEFRRVIGWQRAGAENRSIGLPGTRFRMPDFESLDRKHSSLPSDADVDGSGRR